MRRVSRRTDHQACERLVGRSACDAQQVRHEFVLGIGVGQHIGGRRVHAAQVARVTTIAAAERPRRAFDDDDARTSFRCRQCRTECGVAAAEDRYVVLFLKAQCRMLNAQCSTISEFAIL